MKVSEQKCGNCIYMRKDGERLECHRGYPAPATSPALGWTQKAQAVWPEVRDGNWCANWDDLEEGKK